MAQGEKSTGTGGAPATDTGNMVRRKRSYASNATLAYAPFGTSAGSTSASGTAT